jgi:hypothetical protein
MDVVLVSVQHDGRAMSGPRSRHAVPARTRHEKGGPSKHDCGPSKHRPTIAHDSYIYIHRQTLISPNLPIFNPAAAAASHHPFCILASFVPPSFRARPRGRRRSSSRTQPRDRRAPPGCGHEGLPADGHDIFFLCMDLLWIWLFVMNFLIFVLDSICSSLLSICSSFPHTSLALSSSR